MGRSPGLRRAPRRGARCRRTLHARSAGAAGRGPPGGGRRARGLATARRRRRDRRAPRRGAPRRHARAAGPGRARAWRLARPLEVCLRLAARGGAGHPRAPGALLDPPRPTRPRLGAAPPRPVARQGGAPGDARHPAVMSIQRLIFSMEIRAVTRRWGNSIAVVIPREVLEQERIQENEEIVLQVEKKRPKAGVLFGRFPALKKTPTQQLKDEARRGWESSSDRRKWRS